MLPGKPVDGTLAGYISGRLVPLDAAISFSATLAVVSGGFASNGGRAPGSFSGNLLFGANDGSVAVAGQIGEFIESKISTATNAAATGTYLALASITLTAGDWIISAIADEEPGTGATTTVGGALEALIGTTSAANTGATRGYDWIKNSHSIASVDSITMTIPAKRVSISASTTYFLNVMQTYTAGTPQWRGSLTATRMR